MITGNKDYLTGLARTLQCPEHGPKLVVAWHRDENSYVLRCGDGHYPEEVTPIKSSIQEYKAGKLPAVGPGIDLLQDKDLATGVDISDQQRKFLVDYARYYGLDAYRGHVMLMHGKPYIGLDGYLYHANKTAKGYSLTSRPMTQTERTDLQLEPKDHAWISELTIPENGSYFTGTGIVTQEEMTEPSKYKPDQLRSPVVAKHPWQLAQKRSEWQALRRGFPIGESEEERTDATE